MADGFAPRTEIMLSAMTAPDGVRVPGDRVPGDRVPGDRVPGDRRHANR